VGYDPVPGRRCLRARLSLTLTRIKDEAVPAVFVLVIRGALDVPWPALAVMIPFPHSLHPESFKLALDSCRAPASEAAATSMMGRPGCVDGGCGSRKEDGAARRRLPVGGFVCSREHRYMHSSRVWGSCQQEAC
jgi:hypothetical protein